MKDHTRKRKVLLTLGIVGVIVGLAAFGAFSAFTATTSNSSNQISSGTVKIDQHTGATTLYSASNQKPGDSKVSCVRVKYDGSLPASVKLYVSSGITNGSVYNLKVERGSGLSGPAADMNCTGFTASSTAYDGALGSFATSYAAGYDGKAGGTPWNQSDEVDYRFTITHNDDPTPNAHTSAIGSGAHTFTWEAHNN